MRTDDFSYELPPDRIAQRPARPRDSSRLLRLERESGSLSHHHIRELTGLLNPGDGLVFNNTRVFPARLHGRKQPDGGKVEVLLLRELAEHQWLAMVGGKRVLQGTVIHFKGGLGATVIEELEGPRRRVAFDRSPWPTIEREGEMPLPPYITEPLRDHDDYQTVFADPLGAAAAPTAGLHFTSRLLQELSERGLELIQVTLHVGMDTFAPVHEADPRDHRIHSEWCELASEAARQINKIRTDGGRLVAVGTTAVRTLETAASHSRTAGQVAPFRGATDLFILPGYEFKVVDALITNFHLPRSTLLMLVSAFAGRSAVLGAYAQAIEAGYRFYSFGDAMLIL